MRLSDWATLLVLAVLWGSSFFMVKVAVAYVPPLTLVLARVVIGALALWVVCRAAGKPGVSGFLAHWRAFLALGAIGSAVPFGLLFWAQNHIGIGLASILNATTPVFTALLAVLVFRFEKAEVRVFGGIALGICGVAAMVGIGELTGVGEHPLAQLAVLGAALSYGITGNFAKSFKDIPGLTVAAGQSAGAAIVIAPFALFLEQPWMLAVPPLKVIAAVLALGLLSTGVAYAVFYSLIHRVGATAASLVTILIPAVAALQGALFLGESLGLKHAVGMGLILAGLLVMDRNLRGLAGRLIGRGG